MKKPVMVKPRKMWAVVKKGRIRTVWRYKSVAEATYRYVSQTTVEPVLVTGWPQRRKKK